MYVLFPPLSPIRLLLMFRSFFSDFPLLPLLCRTDRSGWVVLRRGKRAEVLLSLSWAPVPARCELHTSQQWQPDCSVRYCLQTVHGPFTPSALQKLPPELCAQNLIQHAKSVCRSPDCLPNTLNLFNDITLSGEVSFLKSISTHIQVYRHSSSHIQ